MEILKTLLEPFGQYGLAGLIIAALFGYIVYSDKLNRTERKETTDKFTASVDRGNEKTTAALKGLEDAIRFQSSFNNRR